MIGVAVAAAAAVTLFIYAAASSRPWIFETYAVSGNRYLTGDEVVAATGLSYGANLFAVDFGEVETALERHPRIRAARVSRRIPGQLVVEIYERPAAAAIVINGELYKIADDGVVLESIAGNYEDVPTLIGVSFAVRGPIRGRVLRHADVAAGLRVVAGMSAADPAWLADVDWIDIGKRVVSLEEGSKRVRYGADFDDVKARRLRLVYAAVEGVEPGLVFDVRFHNDVVVNGLRTVPEGTGGGSPHGGQV